MLARYMLSSSVRLCLSVCLSQVGVLQRWLKLGSHKQCRTIARDSVSLMPKISTKFQRDHPQRGRKIEVGYLRIGDFRPVSRYISEMVQDMDIVTVEG